MSSTVSLEYLNQALSAIPTVVTKFSMCAQNITKSSIVVQSTGTAIPLATKPYINGFTANAANTIFTVLNTGVYLINYTVDTSSYQTMSSSVCKNGSAVSNLTRTPGVPRATFQTSAIISLVAGDTLRLTLFALSDTITLQGGVSAYLNVIRIV